MGTGQVRRLQNIVRQHPALMWDTKAYDTLDAEAIAEALYNYGSWEDVTEYHRVVGLKTAKRIFCRLRDKPRSNLFPKTRNFFEKYYDRHAS